MPAVLEQAEFAKHLHTKFRIRINESESVEAELADVSDLRLSERQERFAVVFRTSNKTFLGQGTRDVEHDQMGSDAFNLIKRFAAVDRDADVKPGINQVETDQLKRIQFVIHQQDTGPFGLCGKCQFRFFCDDPLSGGGTRMLSWFAHDPNTRPKGH